MKNVRKWLVLAVVLGGSLLAGGWGWSRYRHASDPSSRAQEAYSRGDWEAAADRARLRLKAVADDPEGLRILARSSIRLGRDASAMGIYQRIGPSGMQAEDLYLLGLALTRTGKTVAAREVWERCAGPRPRARRDALRADACVLRVGLLRSGREARQAPGRAAGLGIAGRGVAGHDLCRAERLRRRRRLLGECPGPSGGGARRRAEADRAAHRAGPRLPPRRPPGTGARTAPADPGPEARPRGLLAPEPRRPPGGGLGRGPVGVREGELVPRRGPPAPPTRRRSSARRDAPSAIRPSTSRNRPRGMPGPSSASPSSAAWRCPPRRSPIRPNPRWHTRWDGPATAGCGRRLASTDRSSTPWSSTRSARGIAG